MSGSPERFVRSGTCRDGGGKGMRAAENGACPKGDATCCGSVAGGDGPLRRAKCVDVVGSDSGRSGSFSAKNAG